MCRRHHRGRAPGAGHRRRGVPAGHHALQRRLLRRHGDVDTTSTATTSAAIRGPRATVYEGAIDLKFRNDLSTGALQTVWTPADITVTFWGTKRYEVTSARRKKSNPVPPQTLTVPAGQPCTPSAGGDGFTATDTRTMRDVGHRGDKTSTHTVRYKPSPAVVCAAPPTPPS